MHPIIEKYYNLIKNLKVCAPFISDINKCNYILDHFDTSSAIDLISTITLKYEADINNIAKLKGAKQVVKSTNIMSTLYSTKTNEDVYEDVEYIRDCVIIIATCVCGICPDLTTFIKEINHYDMYNK